MRRWIDFRWLPLVLLVAANTVLADAQPSWLGREVIVKSARVQPRSGGRATSSAVVCVRTVKRVKGDWLLVDDGWLRSADVVPVAEAAAWFTTEIERRPSAYDYVCRAAARCVTGDYEEAVADCASALQINPRFAAAYYHQAAARAKQGRFEDAIEAYAAALRFNPRLVGAYIDRAAARIKLGDYQGSLADANQALRLAPGDANAYYVRSVTRLHLRNYRGALADVNYVVRANPRRAAAYEIRGTCKEEIGQIDAALRDFEKAIQLDPSNTSAQSRRERLRLARKSGAIK